MSIYHSTTSTNPPPVLSRLAGVHHSPPKLNGKPNGKPVVELGPVLICMADVVSRPVSWLWQNRIVEGRLNLLYGNPGEGKSFASCDIASRVTTGSPWPDGSPCQKGNVILISGEDDPSDTIKPRLEAHGADCSRIHLLSTVRRLDPVDGKPYEQMFTLADRDSLEDALRRSPDCKLAIIDPIGSYLGQRTDAYRDNEVRAVLDPVAKLAERYGVAVLVIGHHRKAAGSVADDLIMGSRAFAALARTVWHLLPDPDDANRRLFLSGKNNLAAKPNGLAFTITGEPPKICWEREPIDMSADDLISLRNGGGQRTALREACDFLEFTLADGPRPVGETKTLAKDAGISRRTLALKQA